VITIKTKREIQTMAEGGAILAKVMDELKAMVKPGIKTMDLEKRAQALVLSYKAKPAFLNYVEKQSGKPYPFVLCVSVNNVLVHAFPSGYILKQGDLVGIDLGVKYKGFYTDMAFTLGVGEISFENKRFLKAIYKALKIGIKKCKVGNTFGDVSNTIQRAIESQGFSVVRDLCGHGIGTSLHEAPSIPNFGKRRDGQEIKDGMVFCLEPMATIGDYKLKTSADGFGVETLDGGLACHFEHTIAIVNGKPKVLTMC